jgi:hypothetical protein
MVGKWVLDEFTIEQLQEELQKRKGYIGGLKEPPLKQSFLIEVALSVECAEELAGLDIERYLWRELGTLGRLRDAIPKIESIRGSTWWDYYK